MMRRALGWVLPGGIVLGVATLLAVVVEEPRLVEAVDRYHLVVYGVGLTLSAVFYRSRVFLALAALALLHLVLASDPEAFDPAALGGVYVALLGFLVMTRDRGIFSETGLLQLGGAGLFAAAVAVVSGAVGAEGAPAPLNTPALIERIGLPPGTLVLAAASVIVTAYAIFRWHGAIERGFLWSEAFVVVAFHPALEAGESSLFLAAAGLTLALSVLETTHAMAYRDELTGLPARRALMIDLEDVAGGDAYTVAMVDVDHFKRFNDRYGHDVGDQVLKLVATRLAEASGGARAYRYGGEEFTLLFRGRTKEEVREHAEAVRRAVEASEFSLRSWRRPRQKSKGVEQRRGKAKATSDGGARAISVTVSIGLADSSVEEDGPEDVLKEADHALYRAKDKGRNRVAV